MEVMQLLQVVLHLDRHLGSAIAQHGTAIYVILFAIVFVEIGIVPLFFLPGDPLLFICGAYCATGALDAWIVVPVLFTAAVAGTLLGYGVGHAIGHRITRGDHVWLDKHALLRTHAFFEKYGMWTLLLSPFMAVIRTLAPLVAGISRMTYSRFVTATVLGASLWVLLLVALGYYFGHVPFIREHLSQIVLFGVAIGVGSLLLSGAWRFFAGRPAGDVQRAEH